MPDLRVLSWKELDEYCQNVLSDIVTVELVGRLGSRLNAAEQLEISGSALTGRLGPVNKYLRGPVVEPRASELTPLGLKMRELWSALESPLRTFIASIDRMHETAELRVSTVRSVWEADGARISSAYETEMPGGTIKAVISDGPRSIEEQVRIGDADVGLTSYPPPEKEIAPPEKLIHWRQDQMMLVMSYVDAYSMGGALKVGAEFLNRRKETALFTLPENTAMARSIYGWLRANRIQLRRLVPVPSVEEALKRVADSNGFSILPEPSIEKMAYNLEIDSFQLVPQLLRPVGILYRENSLKKHLVEIFVKCVMSVQKEAKKPAVYDPKQPRPIPGEKPGNV